MKDKEALDTIDHIAVVVKDMVQAVDWYKKHFKCSVVYQDASWAYLDFANIRLALVMAGQHPSHIAFAVANAAQFGVLKTHRDGTQSVYIKDPGGNSVEMVEKAQC